MKEIKSKIISKNFEGEQKLLDCNINEDKNNIEENKEEEKKEKLKL